MTLQRQLALAVTGTGRPAIMFTDLVGYGVLHPFEKLTPQPPLFEREGEVEDRG